MTLRDEHLVIRGSDLEEALLIVHEAGSDASAVNLSDQMGDWAGLEAYEDLKAAGLIRVETSLAAEARLTNRGRRLAEHILAQRTRGGYERNDAVQRLILRTLVEHEGISSLSDLVNLPLGEPFGAEISLEEAQENAEALVEMGLLKVISSLQDPFLRPEVTRLGREALVSSGDATIEAYIQGKRGTRMQQNRSYTNNITGPVGSVAQGDHASVTVNQNISNTDLNEVRALLQQLAALPDVQATPELAEKIAEMAQEASAPSPDRGTLREKLLMLFMTPALTQLGQQVMPALQQIGALLG